MTTLPRRQFLKSGLVLSALSNPLASTAQVSGAQPTPKPGKKKGLAGKSRSPQWAKVVSSLNAHWSYNWTANRPAGQPEGVEWGPMIFKADAGQPIENTVATVRADFPNKPSAVLGFNEPDREMLANMRVETALEAWPKIEELNLPLGSPAGVHADSPWMPSFMSEAMKRKYRIDFVTIHWYGGPSHGQILRRLQQGDTSNGTLGGRCAVEGSPISFFLTRV